MKTTTIEKQMTTKSTTGRGARPVGIAKPDIARKSLTAAADRQIAEIERTFTLRYEW